MDANREAFLAFATSVLSTARQLFLQAIQEYLTQWLDEAFAPGGKFYERVMAGAIASAVAWYGLFTPLKYQRGYTLSARGNILINYSSAAAGEGGYEALATWSVQNISPHAQFSGGWDFMRGGKLVHRPGGDLMASVPDDLTENVEIPTDLASELFDSALSAALEAV